MATEGAVTFIGYLVFLLAIGFYFYRRSATIEDYLLGGLVESWIAIGLFAGTVLNWMLVAGRLRIYTEKTDSITLPGFFQERFKSPWGLYRKLRDHCGRQFIRWAKRRRSLR